MSPGLDTSFLGHGCSLAIKTSTYGTLLGWKGLKLSDLVTEAYLAFEPHLVSQTDSKCLSRGSVSIMNNLPHNRERLTADEVFTLVLNSESDEEQDFRADYPDSEPQSETSDDSDSEDSRSRLTVSDSGEGSRSGSTNRRGMQNVNTFRDDDNAAVDLDLDSNDLASGWSQNFVQRHLDVNSD
ncbi:hypothetical protein PoB_001402600 [Plakobranchus ocellatus]|uniref:Uncharacterized protein n=1 Tax=Plakobranchus ocellatus TaxID=259542 RepID=A0AAV3YYU4_9GAST|nr:hypothetical protein PoB_001402600 [Plakobranchus ocellatus]